MYGNLDSIVRAHRSHVGRAPLVPATEGGPDVQLEDAEPTPEEKPDSSWLKADIQQWLDDSGVDVPSGATKAELLDLVE